MKSVCLGLLVCSLFVLEGRGEAADATLREGDCVHIKQDVERWEDGDNEWYRVKEVGKSKYLLHEYIHYNGRSWTAQSSRRFYAFEGAKAEVCPFFMYEWSK